jgi:TonB family protein
MATRRLLVVTGAWVLLGAVLSAQGGYRVIVNQSNPVAALTKAQISKLFLHNSPWDDGAPAAPVDLPPDSNIREVFSRDMLGMPAALVSERWRKIAASGPGTTQPPLLATDREVLAFVRLKPGAIGYVSMDADLHGVKVVATGGSKTTTVTSSAVPERLIHVQPHYPDAARGARIEGTVSVEVVIGPRGDVEQARIVRSIPMLDEAALNAVRRWKYKPTMVNGAPVPVTMVVHVTFAL